jgi:Holliday junction DNA helicase RuvA
VTGIGPKLALNILSGTDPQELVRSVARGDLNRLVRIPGVGKKTAERIIFDLRDKKIAEISGTQTDEKTLSADVQEMKDDALSALMNLGYKNQAVQDVLERVLRDAGDEEMSLDILLKKTLKILAN